MELSGGRRFHKDFVRVWIRYLTKILVEKVGLKPSVVYECVFNRGSVIYVLYNDDFILAGPNINECKKLLRTLRT